MSGAEAFEPRAIESHAYKVLVKEVKDIAIFFMNPEGDIVSWNDGAQRLKGYTEKDVIGKNYRMLFTDEDKKMESLKRSCRRQKKGGVMKQKIGESARMESSLRRMLRLPASRMRMESCSGFLRSRVMLPHDIKGRRKPLNGRRRSSASAS
jgi:PAS domain S-box-containing protein